MMDILVAEYWIWLIAALIIGLVIAFYVFHASKRTSVTGTSKDVLDEGADRAQRNRALIDSDPAASREPAPAVPKAPAQEPAATPIITPAGLAGTGPAIAAAADAAAAPSAPPSAAADEGDELTRLKGVGPKLAARLRELGVTSVADIAAWNDADIDRIDPQLGRFQGRIRRDAWVDQARLLTGGDQGSYEERFGRLD